MPDVWGAVAEQDGETQARLAEVLELRGADPQQQKLRRTFLDDIPFGDAARVLEVGCGTGVLTRMLARRHGVASVVGVDLAPSLLERARELTADLPNVTFETADALALPFDDVRFDLVVFDSTLTHVPDPGRAIAEAVRVLRGEGVLAAFDGDYSTVTVALGPNDPLQACVDAMVEGSVSDRWVVRKLPALMRAAGLTDVRLRSHGYVETTEGGYMLTIVDRGVDMLHADGQVDDETAAALRAEARRRVDTGTFFGHIAYAGVIARRPG
ncbi:MAG TPA: methyltransferase domain-containing protein [Gaiellaceae bacterium]|jgi:SAM-dependent methyltransferase